MRKKSVVIALLGIILSSCTIDQQGDGSASLVVSTEESFSSSEIRSEESSFSTGSFASSSYERNPFSIKSSSDHYTVSIYQSYYLRRGDDGEPVYGNPRYDYSISVEANQRLYSTMDELNELLDSCNESYHPNGGAYGVYGFYFDETCQRSIGSTFKVTSDMRAYYYCKG